VEQPTINVTVFAALTAETVRQGGSATNAIAAIDAGTSTDLANQLGSAQMTQEEIDHWDWLITQASLGTLQRELVMDVIFLGEIGVYDPDEVAARLGLPI